MFKVECLGCQAPYQVDERRVPATGLQMRCPKCGTSFKVESPTADAPVEADAVPAEISAPFSPIAPSFETKPASALGREALSRTMIGVSSAVAPSKTPFRMPRPGQAEASGRSAGEPEAERTESGELQPRSSVERGELPPVLGGVSPARLENGPERVSSAASGCQQPVAVEIDVEGGQEERVPESLAAPSRPLRLSELPVPVAFSNVEENLPTAVAPKTLDDLPDLASVDDLPAAKLDQTPLDDLPAKLVVPAMPERPRRPPPPRRFKKGPVAAASTAEQAPQADLPAIAEVDLPAIRQAVPPDEANLPAAAIEAPEAGLPALPTVGLPSPAEASTGRSDLPSVLGGTPSPDLPSVLGGAVVDAELPSPAAADMPSLLEAATTGFGRVALPEVHAGLPTVQSALPDVQAVLPEVHATLPGVQSALPEVQGVLPEVHGASQLPEVGEVLPAMALDPGFADNAAQPAEDSPADGAGFSFEDTGSGATSGFSFPPDEEPFGDGQEFSDADPFAASEVGGSAESSVESEEGFGMEASFPLESGGEVSDEIESADVAGYGEVSIGGENAPLDTELDTADDMEFSEVPQENDDCLDGIGDPGSDREASGATLELNTRPDKPVRRLERRIAIAIALGLGVVAGGAMSLQPNLGPFGIHYLLDEVHRSQNERTLSTLRTQAQMSFAKDTLDEARAAITQAEVAAKRAPRFRPFTSHLAILLHTAALRFGPLSEMEAAGKAALRGLKTESPDPKTALARASAKAARLDRTALAELKKAGNSPEAKALLLELQLRLNEPQRALDVLEKSKPRKTARSHFLAARAQLALGQWDAAFASADAVLKLNPNHVGAAIARLDAWRGGISLDEKKASAEGLGNAKKLGVLALTQQVEQAYPNAAPSEKVMAHEVRGDLHLKYGRVSQAQKQFESALAIQRHSPRALVGLGETLLQAGRYAEALARFESAIDTQPEDRRAALGIVEAQLALAHLGKANALIKKLLKEHPKQAKVIYWQGRIEQALDHSEAALLAYRYAIELGQGQAESMHSYLALAQLEAKLGQTVRAARTLEEARTRLPPSSLLFHAMGQTAIQDGKYASALDSFQEALKLDPEDTRARFLGAVALTRIGRYDEALKIFDAVRTTDAAFPGLAMERGRLFEVSGRNAQALEQYEAAHEKSPEDEELKLRLGCARVVEGQTELAIELLEPWLKKNPRSAEVHYCLGRAHFESRHHVQALSLLSRAVSLDDSQAIYHLYEGWVALDVGRTTKAERALDKALSLDNGLGEAYWLRGKLGRKQGAVKDALKDLHRAQKLSPGRVEVLADLAAAYSDLGQRKRALTAWRQATERQPDDATWRFRYGKLLSSMGRTQRAVVQLKLSLKLAEPEISPAGLRGKANQPWLPQAHYLIARTMGRSKKSVVHWQAFLRAATVDNPYRKEAEKALRAMGESWSDR